MWAGQRLGVFRVVAMLLPLLCGSPASAAVIYGVTPLGVPGSGFRPAQINDLGEVVGNTLVVNVGYKPGLWLPQPKYGLAAGLNDLSTQAGFDEDSAAGINNYGQIVGTGHAPIAVGSQRPTMWLPTAAYGRPAGWSVIESILGGAAAINTAGEIAGHHHNVEQARVWRPVAAHGMPAGGTDIFTVGWGFATDINESGQVAGHDFDANTQRDTAFLFLPEPAYGRAAGIHFLPSTFDAQPHAMNNKGLLVGSYDTPPVNGVSTSRAFIWRPSTTFLDGPAGFFDLGGVPNDATYWDLYGADINDLGQVVGSRSIKTPTMSVSANAFIWTRTGGMVDLNTLMDPSSGWELHTASSINAAGDIIGMGTLNGIESAYMLTVPEPSALNLLAPLAALALRRRS